MFRTTLTLGRFASSLCLCRCRCRCRCLCQHGLAGTGPSPRRDSQALCLTSSGRVLAFMCLSLVSQQHISHLFVRAMARPAVNASESNCAHFLDARLELFWAEDWSALWAMVRAECDVAPVQNTTRRTDKQQMQSRVRKVATPARTGEKGRALAAARNASPVPVTQSRLFKIKSLYPADPEPPAPVQAPVSALFLSEVAEHVPTTLRKMPRTTRHARGTWV